jgi:acetyl esterase/lipase
MVQDVSQGMEWVFQNIARFGGDPSQVYLMGQSCGGHLCTLALLHRAEAALKNGGVGDTVDAHIQSQQGLSVVVDGGQELARKPWQLNGCSSMCTWLPSQLKVRSDAHIPCLSPLFHASSVSGSTPASIGRQGHEGAPCLQGFVALSSPLDVIGLRAHFVSRGLAEDILDQILDCSSLPSSEFTASAFDWLASTSSCVCAMLPPVLLLHGDQDATVPHTESLKMKFRLAQRRVPVKCTIYRGATHTSPLLEIPFSGGHDLVLSDLLKFMGIDSLSRNARFWPLLPFPKLVCRIARIVCPF